MDLMYEIQTCEDKLIVNREILQSKDRDFKDIVFDCYDNLKSTMIIAWNDGPATMDDLFKSDFKKQLAKAKDKDVDFSADVDSLGNVTSKLEIKYIIDPEVVYDRYKRIALENTIAKFKEEVEGYQHVRWEVLEYLEKEYKKETEIFQAALELYNKESEIKPDPNEPKRRGRKKKNLSSSIVIKQMSLKEEDLDTDLFIAEQMVLVPEIDRSNRYVIDGINYYGVHNQVYTGFLTNALDLGFKVFKDGRFSTAYFSIVRDEEFGPILQVSIYGFAYNPFHVLTTDPIEEINPTDLLVFNNVKQREDWNEIIMNTYKKAIYMDQHEEDYLFAETKDEKGIRNKKIMHIADPNHRATKKERRYKIAINIGCQMLLEKLEIKANGVTEEHKTKFTHLASLEEIILRHINEENKIPKKKSPKIGVKRVNLNPGLIVSIIKRNSDEKSNTVLFRDSKKAPNPFDIFQIFAYAQTSNHTETSSNKHVSNKAKKTEESTNWINWKNLPYLSIYFSKGNVPLGKNNIMHFDIDSDIMIERNKIKEVFHDIYNARTL